MQAIDGRGKTSISRSFSLSIHTPHREFGGDTGAKNNGQWYGGCTGMRNTGTGLNVLDAVTVSALLADRVAALTCLHNPNGWFDTHATMRAICDAFILFVRHIECCWIGRGGAVQGILFVAVPATG